jgi:SOS response associated peptidase (SRAP)
MCGRYVSVARVAELIEQYKATGPGDDKQLAPSYNVAPTNKVHAVLERDRPDGSGAMREIAALRWGLVPAWWQPGTDPKSGKAKTMPTLHNARSDRWPPRRRGRARSPSVGRSSPPPSTTSGCPPKTPTGTRGSRSMKQLRPAPSSGARSLSLTRHRVELPDIDRHCVHAVQLLEGPRTRC